MIKRYSVIDGKPVLRPDNPAYAKLKWKREMKALGVVVGRFRRIDKGADVRPADQIHSKHHHVSRLQA